MLASLHIQNYALIDKLDISLESGLSIITGETGAGKSIILGALGLLLGNRADSTVLQSKEKKCIIEGQFQVAGQQLEQLFTINDLDYEEACVIRREITVAGKSRAFINDTPVTLPVLKTITSKLVDIHSQHQSLLLNDNFFQLQVVDDNAGLESEFAAYVNTFKTYNEKSKDLDELRKKASESQKDLDYLQFQFNQLDELKFNSEDEQELLEQELNALNHAEDIKRGLTNSIELIENDNQSILQWIKFLKNEISEIEQYITQLKGFPERIESIEIELKDIYSEFENLSGNVEIDPSRIDEINDRLNEIYTQEQKHRVSSLAELISIREDLNQKIGEISSFDDDINELQTEVDGLMSALTGHADALTLKRTATIPKIETSVMDALRQLGMPDSIFKIEHSKLDEFKSHGCDEVEFLFSANDRNHPMPVSKVASGGEISRLMLSVKSLLSRTKTIPTIIFDEVDAGVSGDIADKVGDMLLELSTGIQVINITHLPQVAVKGNYHFQVFKDKLDGTTTTNIRLLKPTERITEIAKMISGDVITPAAIANARSLLNI